MCRNILLALVLLIPFSLAPKLAWGAIYLVHPEFSVESGVRTDQLDWNIAGTINGTNPNILSELSWDDLQIWQLRLKGGLEFAVDEESWFRPYLRAQIGLGRIYSGSNQDSDYNGDNRTLEFSRSNNGADQGDVLDLSLALGQVIALPGERIELIPLIGYSYHEQNLRILNGFQTIPATGSFAGLDSSYDAEWWGGWLGLEIRYKPNSRLLFRGLTEYHRVEYYAAADWNLRTDFAHPLSFEHTADATGWVQELGLEYLLRENCSLSISGIFQDWQTDAGIDRVFGANGSVSVTRLNQVNWKSSAIQFGLSYRF